MWTNGKTNELNDTQANARMKIQKNISIFVEQKKTIVVCALRVMHADKSWMAGPSIPNDAFERQMNQNNYMKQDSQTKYNIENDDISGKLSALEDPWIDVL